MPELTRGHIVDTFALIGTYPFGAPGSYGARDLIADAEALDIVRTYVSSMDAFFRNDVTAANDALLKACAGASERLSPVPTIDLALPDWQGKVADWQNNHRVCGVRIAPNYHGCALIPESFLTLAEILADYEMILFMAAAIEDVRFQPRCLNVSPLALQNILPLLKSVPELRVVLNGFAGQEIVALGSETPTNVFFDVSCMDRPFGMLEKVVTAVGAERFVFGSLHPILTKGAALANLLGSDLPPDRVERILRGFS